MTSRAEFSPSGIDNWGLLVPTVQASIQNVCDEVILPQLQSDHPDRALIRRELATLRVGVNALPNLQRQPQLLAAHLSYIDRLENAAEQVLVQSDTAPQATDGGVSVSPNLSSSPVQPGTERATAYPARLGERKAPLANNPVNLDGAGLTAHDYLAVAQMAGITDRDTALMKQSGVPYIDIFNDNGPAGNNLRTSLARRVVAQRVFVPLEDTIAQLTHSGTESERAVISWLGRTISSIRATMEVGGFGSNTEYFYDNPSLDAQTASFLESVTAHLAQHMVRTGVDQKSIGKYAAVDVIRASSTQQVIGLSLRISDVSVNPYHYVFPKSPL